MDSQQRSVFRDIPSVNDCMGWLVASGALEDIPLQRLKFCVRHFLDIVRQSIQTNRQTRVIVSDRQRLLEELANFVRQYHSLGLRRVINGTGVIVHTNMGRSLLPSAAMAPLQATAAHYSNLELNLDTGKRGSRYHHVEGLLCELTGAESALVVNNNAAAVLLALETLASGKEVIVSRGQLVEIGGSFRIPDIMRRSGARLVEVGTTNRTHLRDYQQAITDDTGLLLRVHCSNYRIIGFTSEVSDAELIRLGKKHDLPVMEDLGSGCLIDLSRFGLAKEPTVQEAVAYGMDIVTFSGDKLLGGPQAGILLGRKYYIDQIKSNPLNRALRIDKLTLATLESVLRLYLDEAQALREIPTLAMIALPEAVLAERAHALCEQWHVLLADYAVFTVQNIWSQVGGGAMPEQNLASWAVAVKPLAMKISQLERRLRQAAVPVIGRVEDGQLLFDLRTIAIDETDTLLASLQTALQSSRDERA
ncbi:MAG: L-seryl-tRNA(Sec) selenium transferase [Desulfobulbus sp.]|uniref:L-seryl-tRNA(Sec) selenium transferase n=1 Tax=Desulfobulbus sp. TaxID=895 RepID=UPI00283F3CBA|nr:L-seryl-tRNA(Sec) selenium transferase [Desulfobulbus sp.]MDR2549953.1 L-seryl-tRNA(Sec) selenium transferase [Desulfobulbus sp.]